MWLISAGVVPAYGQPEGVRDRDAEKARGLRSGIPSRIRDVLDLSTGCPFENDLHLLYILRRNIKWMVYSKFSVGPFGSSQISY